MGGGFVLQCSARCGPGFQHRRVVCARYVDGELDQVDFDECDPAERMPARQNCSGEDCVGIWFSGPWGKVGILSREELFRDCVFFTLLVTFFGPGL